MRENAKKDTETYLEKQSKKSIWTNSYRKLKKKIFFKLKSIRTDFMVLSNSLI